MICNRCKQDFDNNVIDNKGCCSIKIQQNKLDEEYYCMLCAIEMYNEENKKDE